jgi:RNA polymerase sporulation-specific sigma factor
MALMKALGKYRTGSCTFSTYAYTCIQNAFRYTARQNSKTGNELSLNLLVDPSGTRDTEFIDCLDSFENLEEDILRMDNVSEINKAVSKLPDHGILQGPIP